MFGNSILLDKSLTVAVNIAEVANRIKLEEHEYDITAQIIRSSSSVCANIAEARAAASTKDFISKLVIARKEYYETLVWLEYLQRISLLSKNDYLRLTKAFVEVGKMLNRSISTCKKNLSMA